MHKSTIRTLNQLNLDFYRAIGPQFDETRQHYWPGWWRVAELIRTNLIEGQHSISVLDVGCGNGRFASFLAAQFPELTISYTGIDSDRFLLEKAAERATELHSAKFFTVDIVEKLLKNEPLLEGDDQFSVITYFGVQHHIPSFKLRTAALRQLASHMHTRSMLFLTAWQFTAMPRFDDRTIAARSVGLTKQELEANDYILDWRKTTKAFRYCHLTDLAEIAASFEQVNLKLVENYSADAAFNNGNLYAVGRLAEPRSAQ